MLVKVSGARWSWRRFVSVALTVALLAYLGLSAARYYGAYRNLSEAKDILLSVEASLRKNGLDSSPDLIDRSEERLGSARGKFAAADRLLDRDPMLQVARRLPWLGTQVEAADDLAEAGLEATRIGFHGTAAVRTFDRVKREENGAVGQKAVLFLKAVEPQMAAVAEGLASIRSTLESLKGRSLLPPLDDAVNELDVRLPKVEDVVGAYGDANAFAPAFLGFDRPKTYLVLAQDNNELFPTGGLIPIYGLITLDRGRISSKFFEPVSNLNGRWQEANAGDYVEPPGPLKRYLLRDHTWNLGVSNWSPDFPTAARQAQFFLARASSQPVDGVLAFNFITLEEILKVLGKVRVEGYEAAVNASNVTEQTLRLTRRSLASQKDRYAFTGALADAVLEAAFNVESDRWSALLRSLDRLGESKQLLFYSNDPQQQRLVRDLGWDGGLDGYEGDYLMVVNASVNSSKLNLVLDEAMEVAVQLDGEGGADHRVTLRYSNRLSEWERGRDPEFVKETMLDGFYGGYVRLYAPAGAELIDAVQDGEPVGFEEIAVENAKTVAGRFFGLARDEQIELSFMYYIPHTAAMVGDALEYRLLIQKQPGTREIPLRVTVSLPEGSEPLSIELNGEPADGKSLEIDDVLATDGELVVRYRPPERSGLVGAAGEGGDG